MNDAPAPEVLQEPIKAPDFVPGVFEDMPSEHYHAVDALSSTGAKTIVNRSLNHYRWQRLNPTKPTPAMQLGTLTHTAILEPDLLDTQILIRPELDARTKAGKELLAALQAQAAAENRILVTQEDADRVRHMRDAVWRHPGALRLLEGSRRELSIFWRDASTDAPCKARFDVLKPVDDNFICADVKTCEDASPAAFGRTIASYDYHLSAAMYFSGAEHVWNKTPLAWAWIAVEKTAPYGVAVYVAQPDQMLAGNRKFNRAVLLYAEARRTGYWGSYPLTLEPAVMPQWALREPF
jgi:exodeoxyribonuclease VIII